MAGLLQSDLDMPKLSFNSSPLRPNKHKSNVEPKRPRELYDKENFLSPIEENKFHSSPLKRIRRLDPSKGFGRFSVTKKVNSEHKLTPLITVKKMAKPKPQTMLKGKTVLQPFGMQKTLPKEDLVSEFDLRKEFDEIMAYDFEEIEESSVLDLVDNLASTEDLADRIIPIEDSLKLKSEPNHRNLNSSLQGKHSTFNHQPITTVKSITKSNDSIQDLLGLLECDELITKSSFLNPFIIQEKKPVEEDAEYAKFLASLHDDILLDTEDDEVYESEEEEDDSEEWRNDRAVQVTSKEISELLGEYRPAKRGRKTKEQIERHKKIMQKPLSEFHPFNREQLIELKTQMKTYFQIIVQQIGLCDAMVGAQLQYSQAVDLAADLSRFKASSQNVQVSIPESMKEFLVDSYFDIPQLERIDYLTLLSKKRPNLNVCSGPEQVPLSLEVKFKNTRCGLQGCAMPVDLVEFLDSFDFDPLLFPSELYSKKPIRIKFLPSEDDLLLLGMQRYGTNWHLVHSKYLFTKTTKQIQTRYKNLTSRRAPDSAIKQFYFRSTKPLCKEEEELVYLGIQRFGKDFELIAKTYLPYRSHAVLKKLWMELDEQRKDCK